MVRSTKLFAAALLTLAVLVVLANAAVAAPAPAQGQLSQPGAPIQAQTMVTMTIGLAVHSNPAEDLFWGVVAKGAKDAAATYGVTLKTGGSGDPKEQAQLIETYVADKVDGIIVSMANPDALKDAIAKATAAGIPVITINSGGSKSKEFGALAHVGQEEEVAGNGAGLKFKDAGAKKVLCVIHEEGNVGLEARCDGLAASLGGEVVRFNVATTGVKDVRGTTTAIQDKLTADSAIDGVLALNPVVGIAALDAVKAVNGTQKVATFDLSPDVLTAVENGQLLFAIDQQQYLQGYLPVVMLYLFKTNLNTIGGGLPVLTGPGFVTKDNAAQVKTLSAQGTR